MRSTWKISVVMTCFKCEKNIGKAIKTCSNLFNSFELIIMNNGSNDESEREINQLLLEDERFRCHVFWRRTYVATRRKNRLSKSTSPLCMPMMIY